MRSLLSKIWELVATALNIVWTIFLFFVGLAMVFGGLYYLFDLLGGSRGRQIGWWEPFVGIAVTWYGAHLVYTIGGYLWEMYRERVTRRP